MSVARLPKSDPLRLLSPDLLALTNGSCTMTIALALSFDPS